jgi:heme a synthase
MSVSTPAAPRARLAESGISADDWRMSIPAPRRRMLRWWLGTGAALTLAIVVIGGITRLTQSGLSIVDWNPIMGVIPPLSHAEWMAAFDRYREFPEYQVLRRGMTLSEFQFIFFWEYFHRLVARTIGLVFLVPFLVFWWRGFFPRPLLVRVAGLFFLGAAQGVMGWYMVMSGLVDNPAVSHYRLAAHLSLALAILATCVWLMRDLALADRPADASPGREARRWVWALGALVMVQIVWGAFVAGLKAGRMFNTFPLMGGSLLPPNGLGLRPALLNLVENPITVQWMHRVLGTVLLLAAAAAVVRMRREEAWVRRLGVAFLALIVAQYALGVATLLLAVPISLGVLHQLMAAIVLAVWIAWLHRVRTASQVAAPGLRPEGASDPVRRARGRRMEAVLPRD